MTNNNFYIDFHVIQTVPPSCLNRDDTNRPKTAVYGGAMRARVSSQSWKRAIRLMFRDLLDPEMLGYRTKEVPALVKDEILRMEPELGEERAGELADTVLELAGVKAGSDKKGVLFFISSMQIASVAELACLYNKDESPKKEKDKEYKKRLESALESNPSVDILLFGRMAASNPNLNFDACAQVAHSISTHAVNTEYDYFTAVDDCAPEDNAGAGHLGTVEFNSSTLYRYATVNVAQLAQHLTSEELKKAVRGFAEAFIRSMPAGKMNTFANRTLPDMVYVTVRSDQPVNLAGAFEKPVSAGAAGYVENSEAAIRGYSEKVYADYCTAPEKAWVIGAEMPAAERVNINDFLNALEQEVEAAASGEA